MVYSNGPGALEGSSFYGELNGGQATETLGLTRDDDGDKQVAQRVQTYQRRTAPLPLLISGSSVGYGATWRGG